MGVTWEHFGVSMVRFWGCMGIFGVGMVRPRG